MAKVVKKAVKKATVKKAVKKATAKNTVTKKATNKVAKLKTPLKCVGKNIARTDGYDKATGIGLFTHDVKMPGMLYAKVLRSPYAHAKVLSIDTTEAEKLEGVEAVCTYKNTIKKYFNTSATMVTTNAPEEPVRDQLVFTDEPLYIGDEIAAVCATSLEIAKKAISLIKVTYKELPAVTDELEAIKPKAPKVQPIIGKNTDKEYNNVCGKRVEFGIGNIKKGFKEADYVVDVQIKLPRQKQCQMETHAAVAYYKPNGEMEIISTTQTPHPTKMIVAYAFNLPESKVHVKNPPHVGGGFGVRIGISGKAEIIAAALSMKALKPVKLVYTREEDFIASDTRHGGHLYCKLGAKKNGTFVVLDTTAILNTGAYCTFGVELLGVCGTCGTALTYHVPNMHYLGLPIYTHQQTAGAFQGFGTPQGTAVVEAAVDAMAKKLKMDPIKLRKMNTGKENRRPGKDMFLPFTYGSVGTNECLDRAAKEIGWLKKRGKKQTGNIRYGVGIACGSHVSNAAPFCVDYNACYVRFEQDGTFTVSSGIPEIGPGSSTAVLQVCCDLMGVPFETSKFLYGDTHTSPFDIGSHATRSLYSASQVCKAAIEDLKEDLFKWITSSDIAKKFSKMPVKELKQFTSADLTTFVKFYGKNPKLLVLEDGIVKCGNIKMPLKQICYFAHVNGKQFVASKCMVPPNSIPFFAQAAEVEVDMELGLVKVLKVVAAHDVGKTVNPYLCEGQIEGGVLRGVGYATREEMTYQEGKGFYNDGIHKYMLPTADDYPEIVPICVETNDPKGVYGLKGIGEVGICGIVPAVLSAVEDATGVRFEETPLTPGRVLKKFQELGLVKKIEAPKM